MLIWRKKNICKYMRCIWWHDNVPRTKVLGLIIQGAHRPRTYVRGFTLQPLYSIRELFIAVNDIYFFFGWHSVSQWWKRWRKLNHNQLIYTRTMRDNLKYRWLCWPVIWQVGSIHSLMWVLFHFHSGVHCIQHLWRKEGAYGQISAFCNRTPSVLTAYVRKIILHFPHNYFSERCQMQT